MGTGFPRGVVVAKVIFNQLVIFVCNFFKKFGMDIADRCEAIVLVDRLGIKLDWPAPAVDVERVLARPMCIKFSYYGGICLGRL